MRKNIINGGRPSTTSGGGGGGGTGGGNTDTFTHLAISEPWVDDLGNTEVFTVDFFKQGSLVTMVMPRVALDMQGVNNWRRAFLVPSTWLPQSHTTVCFSAATNINSTEGRHEYDVDTLCLAEVSVGGSVILWRQPAPATGTWTRPNDTSRVGWNSFSLQWVIVQPD